jgi:hypothetical protein
MKVKSLLDLMCSSKTGEVVCSVEQGKSSPEYLKSLIFLTPLLQITCNMKRAQHSRGDLILCKIPWSMHSHCFIPGQPNICSQQHSSQHWASDGPHWDAAIPGNMKFQPHILSACVMQGSPWKGGVLAKRGPLFLTLRGLPLDLAGWFSTSCI